MYYNTSSCRKRATALYIFFLLISSILTIQLNDEQGSTVTAMGISYTPAPPVGPNQGFVFIEYDYTIYTTNTGASWLFDWGDGSTSGWLQVEEGKRSLTATHVWQSTGTYQVKVQFKSASFPNGVWSPLLEVTVTFYTNEDIPLVPSVTTVLSSGSVGVAYQCTTVATDNQGDFVQYRFDWGDDNYSNWTALVRSEQPVTMTHTWSHQGTYQVSAQVRDQYGLTSLWSTPFSVNIDQDTDGDGFSNPVERQLGSNPYDPDDVLPIEIEDQSYFIIQTADQPFIYDITAEKADLSVQWYNQKYLIDSDNDGHFDYAYTPSLGTLEAYQEPALTIPTFLVPVVIFITAILLCFFLLIKTGYIYLYQEYVVEE